MLNVSIPRFSCFVRDRYLHGLDGRTGVTQAVAYGAASIPGRSVGFHVLLLNGAMIGRLPPSALCFRPEVEERPTHHIQLWNCFSYEMSATEYDFLEGMRVQVRLRNGDLVPGTYLFTLDWGGSVDSEDVGDLGWKCGHVIQLDEGNLAIQPNNRLRWAEPSFISWDEPWPPDYQTINYIKRCEQHGKLVISDDRMFFEVREDGPDVRISE